MKGDGSTSFMFVDMPSNHEVLLDRVKSLVEADFRPDEMSEVTRKDVNKILLKSENFLIVLISISVLVGTVLWGY